MGGAQAPSTLRIRPGPSPECARASCRAFPPAPRRTSLARVSAGPFASRVRHPGSQQSLRGEKARRAPAVLGTCECPWARLSPSAGRRFASPLAARRSTPALHLFLEDTGSDQTAPSRCGDPQSSGGRTHVSFPGMKDRETSVERNYMQRLKPELPCDSHFGDRRAQSPARCDLLSE